MNSRPVLSPASVSFMIEFSHQTSEGPAPGQDASSAATPGKGGDPPQPFRRPHAAKTEPPVRQGLSWTTFGVQLLEGPGVAPTGALCTTGQAGSWGCRVVLRPSRLRAAVFLWSPSWYKGLLSCLSGPTWPCGQPSTACRDPFTWAMLLTKTEHSTGTRPLPTVPAWTLDSYWQN